MAEASTKQSSTLNMARDFAIRAMRIAGLGSQLIEYFTERGDMRAVIACRRVRDQASLLTLEFESWAIRPTTREERLGCLDRLGELQRVSNEFELLACNRAPGPTK